MKTILITGASNGIGYELAKLYAKEGKNLLLVARNQQRLEEIKVELENKSKGHVVCFPADLAQQSESEKLVLFVNEHGFKVSLLINNAGFGDFGFFHEADWNKINQMIQLNITNLTYLSRVFAEQMVKNHEGKILNVASTAAFQPGPTMAVYYATKAYVLHFSEAISNELKDKGVHVMALCPGPTESGFQAAAAMEESKIVKGKKLPTSAEVALYAYKSLEKNKVVAIHGLLNQLLVFAIRFTPRNLIVKLVRKLQSA